MNSLSLSQMPASSPIWLVVLVGSVLALHIAAGSAAILSGYTSMLAAKGGPLHRRAGFVFIGAMLIMGCAGSALAAHIHQRNNVAAGLLAAYLVATAWMTVRRPAGRVGRFETGAFLLVLGLAILFLLWGLQARAAPSQLLDGFPAGPYFGVACISAFFAWGDWRMIRQGGLAGTPRIARHAGRMGFALFLAAGSFFLGQQKVMPAEWHGSPVLLALGLAPLALTAFWLVKVRLRKSARRSPLPA